MDFIEADVLTTEHLDSEHSSPAFRAAQAARTRILERLSDEGADDLHERLSKCGEPIRLHCTCCGRIRESEKRCDLKWCPVCSRRRAARLSAKYRRASGLMQWPMHVTLTRSNLATISAEAIHDLKRGFKQLRRRDIFKKNVLGGVSSVELTNTGRGWHPHLHVLADCEWLAIETPRPKHFHSRGTKKRLFQAASAELEREWSDCIGQLMSSLKVRRCDGATAVAEVLKYCVKGDHLADSPDDIAPAIRAISAGRLVAAFGTLYHMRKELREPTKPSLACGDCGAMGAWMPEETVAKIIRQRR